MSVISSLDLETLADESNKLNYGDLCPADYAILDNDQKNLLRKLGNYSSPPYLEEKLIGGGRFESRDEYVEAFTEFKKYVALTQISRIKIGMTSEKIDEVWHQFILFTPQYHEFCKEFLGGYLHHVPETSTTKGNPKGGMNFVRAYQETFGELPDIWKSQEFNVNEHSSGCSTACSGSGGCSHGCGSCSNE